MRHLLTILAALAFIFVIAIVGSAAPFIVAGLWAFIVVCFCIVAVVAALSGVITALTRIVRRVFE